MVKRCTVSVSDLFLDLHNPREPASTQEDAIEWLCENENIDAIAQDIAELGLNPLEMIGLLKVESDDGANIWIPLEGNRRVCAIKLLADPEMAPTTKLREKFRKLHENWIEPFDNLECVCFENREEADIWVERLHSGFQGGIGRHDWNAIQKQRWNDSPANRRALKVLEYALKNEWIDEEQIRNKLTTATRYLNNDKLRSTIGLGDSKEELTHTKPVDVFKHFLKQFVLDLINSQVGGRVHSRANTPEIEEYADLLLKEYVATHKDDEDVHHIHDPKPVNPSSANPDAPDEDKRRAAPKPKAPKPNKPKKVSLPYNKELKEALDQHGNAKLVNLYLSLFHVKMDDGLVPLLTIGIWSFVESLTNDLDRKGNQPFDAFCSPYLKAYPKEKSKGIKEALKELVQLGNVTKHDGSYAPFRGEPLVTIMETISPFLVYLIKNIKS